jgi:tRNA A-37 threonylcarbamoyl transferase component Bud32
MYSKNLERDFRIRLEPYALKSIHSNEAFRIPFNDRFVLVKVYGPKKPRFAYEIRNMLNRIGIRQPIEYLSPRKRKYWEEIYLRHWREQGFHVPEVLTSPFTEYEEIPHLTTAFIEGVTLEAILRQGFSSSRDILGNFFEDISKRHQQALRSLDHVLFHVDANTQNILVLENQFYHVDFEMGRPWEQPGESACREVSKLLVSMGEDLKPEERMLVYALFKKCYQDKDLLDRLDKSVNGRPFQKLHRWRNEKKKRRNSRRVTLYDLLDSLRNIGGDFSVPPEEKT